MVSYCTVQNSIHCNTTYDKFGWWKHGGKKRQFMIFVVQAWLRQKYYAPQVRPGQGSYPCAIRDSSWTVYILCRWDTHLNHWAHLGFSWTIHFMPLLFRIYHLLSRNHVVYPAHKFELQNSLNWAINRTNIPHRAPCSCLAPLLWILKVSCFSIWIILQP